MLAYSELEPWGPLQADFRAGQICATLANVNRDPRARSEPWAARDFFPSLDRAMSSIPRASAAVLLDDPQAQSDLIKQAIFGVQP